VVLRVLPRMMRVVLHGRLAGRTMRLSWMAVLASIMVLGRTLLEVKLGVRVLLLLLLLLRSWRRLGGWRTIAVGLAAAIAVVRIIQN
jgi:hypothetical protein